MATITVKGRDAEVTAKNRAHAEEKIAKLEKYFDRISRIEVLLGHSGASAEVELVISVPKKKPIVCHASAKDLYTAVDLVVDKAEIQLTKFKEKLKEHKGPKGTFVGDLAAENKSDDDGLESYDEVIQKRDF